MLSGIMPLATEFLATDQRCSFSIYLEYGLNFRYNGGDLIYVGTFQAMHDFDLSDHGADDHVVARRSLA